MSGGHAAATEPNIADYADLIRLERVSKRLEAVRLRCPVAVSVLESGMVVLGFVLPAGFGFALFAAPVVWMIKRRRRAQLAGAAA